MTQALPARQQSNKSCLSRISASWFVYANSGWYMQHYFFSLIRRIWKFGHQNCALRDQVAELAIQGSFLLWKHKTYTKGFSSLVLKIQDLSAI